MIWWPLNYCPPGHKISSRSHLAWAFWRIQRLSKTLIDIMRCIKSHCRCCSTQLALRGWCFKASSLLVVVVATKLEKPRQSRKERPRRKGTLRRVMEAKNYARTFVFHRVKSWRAAEKRPATKFCFFFSWKYHLCRPFFVCLSFKTVVVAVRQSRPFFADHRTL